MTVWIREMIFALVFALLGVLVKSLMVKLKLIYTAVTKDEAPERLT